MSSIHSQLWLELTWNKSVWSCLSHHCGHLFIVVILSLAFFSVYDRRVNYLPIPISIVLQSGTGGGWSLAICSLLLPLIHICLGWIIDNQLQWFTTSSSYYNICITCVNSYELHLRVSELMAWSMITKMWPLYSHTWFHCIWRNLFSFSIYCMKFLVNWISGT